jgi:hypothetical protein
MSIYLVTAYRWGSTNDHQYQVYAGADRTKADALAALEVSERGGKYDCAVYEFNEDGTEYKLASYHAAYDQTEPRHNWRIDMFEELGHFMHAYGLRGSPHRQQNLLRSARGSATPPISDFMFIATRCPQAQRLTPGTLVEIL